MRDLMAELDTPSADSAERWNPVPGDSIVGTVICFEDRNLKFGPCRVVIVLDEERRTHRAIWLQHKVLRDLFDAKNPRSGDRVGVKRLADGNGKNGRFALYRLVIERAPVENRTSRPNEPILDAPLATGGDASTESEVALDTDGNEIPF